jgi:hypothetical protein
MRQSVAKGGSEQERETASPPPLPAAPPPHALLALQRTAGNRAVGAMLARVEGVGNAPAAPPLLLTDRPWREIEEEIGARNRAPFLGPGPLSGDLAGIEFPIVITMPEPAPPPLLLDSVPYAERERLDRNQQKAPGQYKRPEGEYTDELASAPEDVQRLLFVPVKAAFAAALGKLDSSDKENPDFKRLFSAAKSANDKLQATLPRDYSGVIAAAEAVTDWVDAHLVAKAERLRTTRVKDGGKFSKAVDDKAGAAEAAANQEPKRSEKRAKLETVRKALVNLGNETFAGVSPADRERFATLAAELDALLKGVTVAAPVAPSGPVADPDEDGRSGTEATLVYRGQTYHLIPGNPARTYGRIDPALRLTDVVHDGYFGALQHGFVAPNEQGESGVKAKPLYFEIKLIRKQVKRLGVGDTARLHSGDAVGLVQASTGIRYVTFDHWKDAH